MALINSSTARFTLTDGRVRASPNPFLNDPQHSRACRVLDLDLASHATVATEEARRALIEMARVWTRLADETARPLVQQQQQQVQPKDE
jgi:hypothetical protein